MNDTGTAARFFFQAAWNLEHADPVLYCAKASRKERDAGLEEWEEREGNCAVGMNLVTAANWGDSEQTVYERKTKRRNVHPTVKPIALAQWLATLLLPPEE